MDAHSLSKHVNDLNHKDPATRRSAAQSLSQGDERAVYPLIKTLHDENSGVQDAAIRSLMSIQTESTAYMVLPLLRESAYLRNTAILVLREIGRTAIPILRNVLQDRDDDVRKFALDLIHDIGNCDYPDEIIHMLESDANVNVRTAAAKALGKLRYKPSIPALINALTDDEWVCFSVIEALTQMDDDRPVDMIMKLLDSPSDALRCAAIEALGQIGSRKAGPTLVSRLDGADEIERSSIIRSLVQIGMVSSVPGASAALLEMLKQGSREDKCIALRGLALLKDEDSIATILDIAGSFDPSISDDENILTLARKAIQGIGSIEAITRVLKDPSLKYRGKVIAIEAIGDMKSKNAVPALISMLRSHCRDIRRSVIASLGRINSNDINEVKTCLIESISDHDSHVRKTAISALGDIGDMAAFEPLVDLLREERFEDVIDEIILALLKINAPLVPSRLNGLSEYILKRAVGMKEQSETGDL